MSLYEIIYTMVTTVNVTAVTKLIFFVLNWFHKGVE